jgi:hypothetical protein
VLFCNGELAFLKIPQEQQEEGISYTTWFYLIVQM